MSFSDSNFSFCDNSWKNLLDMGFIFVKRDIYMVYLCYRDVLWGIVETSGA